jgi:hypothetical protein
MFGRVFSVVASAVSGVPPPQWLPAFSEWRQWLLPSAFSFVRFS